MKFTVQTRHAPLPATADAALHAEVSGDGRQIVLMGTGRDADIADMAARLKLATPLIQASKPPGALLLTLTWPAVVQLSAMFGPKWRPGPRLTAWIGQQLAARTRTGGELSFSLPEGLTPRPYQVEGALMIAALGRALIFDDPGCISGDAVMAINRAGKGFSLPLRDLVHRFNGGTPPGGRRWRADIPTYVQREVAGIVRLGRIKSAWSSGIKTTHTVTTESGRTVRATDEHPFLTERGWLRLDQLQPGDLVHVRGQQATTGRVSKPTYKEVAGLRGHPYARRRRTGTTSPYRVVEHRLVAEADLNRLPLDEYVEKLRQNKVEGLRFLDPASHAVHHKDHNPKNNTLSNLTVLTHTEHHAEHAHAGDANNVLFKVVTERVVSVDRFGQEETFDIEVEDDPHNFLANGFVMHNTGKTWTAILGLLERSLSADVFPVVVVAPNSVVDPWIDAWRALGPKWRAVAWRGSPDKRAKLSGTADVYVSSYGTARMDAANAKGKLMALQARSIVVDECHLIAHPDTQQSRACRRLAKHADNFIALSGTPITHHPGDLWSALEGLEPLAWPSKERYITRYCERIQGDYKEQILGLLPHAEPEFRTSLLGQHRRAAKADVLQHLPPKIYSVRMVEMPAEHRKAYDQMEKDMIASLPDGGELAVMSVLAQMTRLMQLASAAADVTTTWEPGPDGLDVEKTHVRLKLPSWKVDALMEVLAERPDEQVVVFSPSRQLINLAGQVATGSGLHVGYVVGGQPATERTETVERFQKGKLDLLCATTQAGGVGLTLTAARTSVFLGRPWSLVDSMQAEDRIHRLGSERHESVEIIDVITADTIEPRIRAALQRKAGQLADLVKDPRIVTELLGGISVRGGTNPRKKRKAA